MSGISGPKIITSGCVLSLDAADIFSYPRTGTTWKDLSGNNNNGTLTNGPTFNAGNGGHIVLDGVDDWINLPTSGFGLSSFSIEFWIKFNATGNDGYWWAIADSSGGNPELRLSFTTSNKLKYIWYDSSAYIINSFSQATLTVGTWYHITNTTQNNDYKFYINSVIDSSFTGTTYNGGTLACHSIGTYNLNGTSPGYGGYISMGLGSYKFYNRVLSSSEVSQNYNAVKSRFGL